MIFYKEHFDIYDISLQFGPKNNLDHLWCSNSSLSFLYLTHMNRPNEQA